MEYFTVPLTITVKAENLHEAKLKAACFMPWTWNGHDWSLTHHDAIYGMDIDCWSINDWDSDDMEAELKELGWR